jgi:Gpi18-like mannosyltransferase
VNSFSFKQFLSTPWFIVLLLSAVTLICFAFALQFEIFEGSSDNFIHYRVSRYAFKYPELFLDHWGKPIFTLLSSPFAQFGFKGFIFFNILCGVLASYFTWKVAEKLKLSHAWSAMVLVLTMPIYYIMMVSVMTEVLFSLVLILSVYFILQERFILAAIFFSSLFLIRTEGYILYPFVAFVFAIKRQWKTIPFLGFFFLIYSIIGWFYF